MAVYAPSPSHPYRVAIHEAGHAVAVLNYRIGAHRNGVSILPEGETVGRAWHRPLPETFNPEWMTKATEMTCRRRACVALAGFAAEQLAFGNRIWPVGCQQDFDWATKLMEKVAQHNALADAWVNLLLLEAKTILALPWHWRTTKMVAEILVQRKQLRYGQIRRMLADARKSATFERDRPPFPPESTAKD
ncbi:MAG: hypothetical protein IT462_15225 [Planctomycetes bacterium]|nr:hypothetical protein [Planctomycetota bacterium]